MVSIYHRAVKRLLDHAGVAWDDYCKIVRTHTLKTVAAADKDILMTAGEDLATTIEDFYGAALSENMHMGMFFQVIALLDGNAAYEACRSRDDSQWCSQQRVLLEGKTPISDSLNTCFALSNARKKILKELRIDTEEFDVLFDDYLDLMHIDCEERVFDIITGINDHVLQVANFYVFLQVIAPRITRWNAMVHS